MKKRKTEGKIKTKISPLIAGMSCLLIFAMIFNGGFGNNNRNYATQEYVGSEFTQQAINNGFENVNSNLFNGFTILVAI